MPSERHGPLDHDGTVALIDLLMSPSPASHVGIVLREYRKLAWEFEQAWAQALRTLPRSLPDIAEWRRVLHGQKETWRDAYEQPSEPLPDPFALA